MDAEDLNNYRQISNLTFMSNLVETGEGRCIKINQLPQRA